MILHDEEWWGNLKADACQPKQDIERNVKPISFLGVNLKDDTRSARFDS